MSYSVDKGGALLRKKDIRIPVTEEEHEEISRRAAVTGRTMADWARRVLLGHEQAPPAEREPEPDGRTARKA